MAELPVRRGWTPRTALVAAALACAIAAPASSQASGAARERLLAARDAVWRAWFAADSAALSVLLPDVVAAGSRGGWQSRDATMAEAHRFVRGGGRLVSLQFDSTSIDLRGNVAVVQSTYRLVLEEGGAPVSRSGRATEIFVRENGRWVNPFWYLQ